ncbi:MAG TPA: YqaJ viral recombinase family protein, partial [Polyangiaceae bacterium]|nr:YqaJ viral recombinase family protein [Polyangiaceae bacterium]
MSLTEKQLAMRRSGITATDVRALSGLDPYGRSPHDVWLDKMGMSSATSESEAMSLGNELEPIVLRRLAEKRGLHVLRVDPESLTMRHPRVAHHLATPDAWLAKTAVHDPEAIAQVKVVGLRTAHEWAEDTETADGIPEYVLIQCAWELYVSMQVVEHVGALIGTQVRAYRVELTPDIAHVIEALREVADRFWADHVLTKKPPAVDGSDGSARMLRKLFPSGGGPVVRAGDEVELLASKYFEAKRELEQHEGKIEQLKQLLITACGDAGGIVGEGWRLKYELRAAREVAPKP